MGNAIRAGLVVVIAALALAGCGVNGPLEPPGGAAAAEQRADKTAPKTHQPFVLDGLLR
jgi:predicted small lipoprotein YifL